MTPGKAMALRWVLLSWTIGCLTVIVSLRGKNNNNLGGEEAAANHSSARGLHPALNVVAAAEQFRESRAQTISQSAAGIWNNPEYRRLSILQNGTRFVMEYAALLRLLKLDDPTRRQLQALIADRFFTRVEAGQIAKESLFRLKTSAEVASFLELCSAPVDDEIRSLIGDEHFRLFKRVENVRTESKQLEPLLLRLNAAGDPLDDHKALDLAELLKAQKVSVNGAAMEITPECVELAKSILSPSQMSYFYRFSVQQKALSQMLGIANARLGAPEHP